MKKPTLTELRAIDEGSQELLDIIAQLQRKTGTRYLRMLRLIKLDAPGSIIERERKLLAEGVTEHAVVYAEYLELQHKREELVSGTWRDFEEALLTAEGEEPDDDES